MVRFQKVTGLAFRAGASFTFFSGGGGGYGNPLEREAERVAEDVRMGYVSLAAARRQYGVVLKAPSLRLDEAATRRLRDRLWKGSGARRGVGARGRTRR